MKYLLYFLFITYLNATCTPQETKESNRLYTQASQASTPNEQISLIEQSLLSCYAPEIETSLLRLKARQSDSVEEQILLYKQALVAVSKFSDEQLLLQEQNQLNQILAKLYESINPEISDIYRLKVIHLLSSDADDGVFPYVVYLLFIVLFGLGILGVFRKK